MTFSFCVPVFSFSYKVTQHIELEPTLHLHDFILTNYNFEDYLQSSTIHKDWGLRLEHILLKDTIQWTTEGVLLGKI